jgi:hypothetical protein
MPLITEPYTTQISRWPATGRHILAQYDDETIVVYQAYRPAIGHFAARSGYFGSEYSLSRMSWIKPNFLWMMYRCGWGAKEGQEVVLAIRLGRAAFDTILEHSVHSTFNPDIYVGQSQWKLELERSPVRLQWDPDHAPSGARVERRAIQLGLRGDVLAKYAREWSVDIEDISEFVRTQRANAVVPYKNLVTPRETVYPVTDQPVAERLGLSSVPV